MEALTKLRAWVCDKQRACCEFRPDNNIHKRTLYNTHQQFIDKLDVELAALAQADAKEGKS